MKFASALLFLLALSPALHAADDTALGEHLRGLGAPTAAERDAAQRWLAANLAREHFGQLAASARGADAEATRRLVQALGADGAHLDLVVLLCSEEDEGLRDLGERAFIELALRWCPNVTDKPASRLAVQAHLAGHARRHAQDRDRTETVGVALDRLARLSDLDVPLVVAPPIADAPATSVSGSRSTLERLSELSTTGGFSFAGVGGWERGQEPGAGAWILVTPRGGARKQPGTRRLLRWCLQVELGRPEAPDAARALAATAWPAALRWLGRRWAERGDDAALEGLLLAAARGRVAPELWSADARAELVRRADEFAAAGGQVQRVSFDRVARALAALPALSLGGVDSSAELLPRDGQLPAQRWLRLVALEGAHSGRGDVRDGLLALVEGGEEPELALRFQALRALAASPRLPLRPVRVARLAELVDWVAERGATRELGDLIDVLEAELDGSADGGQGLGASEARRIFLAGAALRRGRTELTVELLATHAGRRAPEADRLAPEAASWIAALEAWRLELGPREVRSVVRTALSRVEGEARASVRAQALLAGVLDAAGERELFARLEEQQDFDALEIELLGALGGGAVRRSAQALLQDLLREPPADPARRRALVRALSRARAELLMRRRDLEAKELRGEVWSLTQDASHPLHAALASGSWPPPPESLTVRWTEREREVPGELWPAPPAPSSSR